jgi:uncharacterized membrane protein
LGFCVILRPKQIAQITVSQIVKYISVLLASTIKFIGGPITGRALGLTWWETASFSVLGMMMVVVLIAFTGEKLQKLFAKNKPKLFSKRTRLAIRIRQRFGLVGIAFLTPIFFTPIGGTLIAISFKYSIQKIIVNMLFFAVFWGVILSGTLHFMGDFMSKIK